MRTKGRLARERRHHATIRLGLVTGSEHHGLTLQAVELAGGPGFEPRLTESESAVLPLNYPPTGFWPEARGGAGRSGGSVAPGFWHFKLCLAVGRAFGGPAPGGAASLVRKRRPAARVVERGRRSRVRRGPMARQKRRGAGCGRVSEETGTRSVVRVGGHGAGPRLWPPRFVSRHTRCTAGVARPRPSRSP